MSGLNPFSYIDFARVQLKIENLKNEAPELSAAELAQKLIRTSSFKCSLLGVVVALPALIPGLGTAVAFIGGIIVDITVMSYLLANLILEIAAIYNRNLEVNDTLREAVWVFAMAVGSDAVGRKLSRTLVARLSSASYTNYLRKLMWLLGARITRKSVFMRIIPLLGALIAGVVNYTSSNLIGKRALNYYQNNSFDSWNGTTIEAEFKVVD
jgi:hypothetical protein